MKYLQIVLIVLLLWALIPSNQYSYYQLLRLIMFIANLTLLNRIFKYKNDRWIWVFGTIALIYNPLFPIHLNRTVWSIINILTVIIYFVSIIKKITSEGEQK